MHSRGNPAWERRQNHHDPFPTAAAQSAGPLRIGVLGDFSGPDAGISGEGSAVAAGFAIEDFGGAGVVRPGKRLPRIDVAYLAVLQYLRAVRQAETATAEPVMQALRSMTVSDMFTPHGTIRMDGKMIFDRYMVRVKSPSESKFPWYYLEITDKIAAADAFRPLSESECRLVRS